MLPVLVALAGALLTLGACSQSTAFYGAPTSELRGKPMLLLRPSLQAPTSEAMQQRLEQRFTETLAKSEDVGPLTRPEELDSRTDLPLRVRDAYTLFSNTLSLTGVSDPELANRLYKSLGVELLAVAQPAYLPCPVCEEGDQLWVVGQVVQARTGRLIFRGHFSAPAPSGDPAALDALADELMGDLLHAMAFAFHPRPHRVRFEHLKHSSSG